MPRDLYKLFSVNKDEDISGGVRKIRPHNIEEIGGDIGGPSRAIDRSASKAVRSKLAESIPNKVVTNIYNSYQTARDKAKTLKKLDKNEPGYLSKSMDRAIKNDRELTKNQKVYQIEQKMKQKKSSEGNTSGRVRANQAKAMKFLNPKPYKPGKD